MTMVISFAKTIIELLKISLDMKIDSMSHNNTTPTKRAKTKNRKNIIHVFKMYFIPSYIHGINLCLIGVLNSLIQFFV